MQLAQAAGPAHLCIQFSAFLFCFSFVSVLAGTRVTIPHTLPPPSPSLPLSASVCACACVCVCVCVCVCACVCVSVLSLSVTLDVNAFIPCGGLICCIEDSFSPLNQ